VLGSIEAACVQQVCACQRNAVSIALSAGAPALVATATEEKLLPPSSVGPKPAGSFLVP
jgi:hypothetical protein